MAIWTMLLVAVCLYWGSGGPSLPDPQTRDGVGIFFVRHALLVREAWFPDNLAMQVVSGDQDHLLLTSVVDWEH